MVHCIEARDLEGKDANHMSDPICLVHLGPTAKRTRETHAKSRTVNAVWEERFVFDRVRLTEEEFNREKICLEVTDKNNFARNAFIGSYELSLSHIYRQKEHQFYREWFPLTQPTRPTTPLGYILVTVYVLGENDPVPNHVRPLSVCDCVWSGMISCHAICVRGTCRCVEIMFLSAVFKMYILFCRKNQEKPSN